MTAASNFAPFRTARPGAAKYRDANDTDDDGLADDDGAAREMAEFIKRSFREAQGEPEPDEDKSDEAAKALARATTYEERRDASARLIIECGRRTGVL